MANLSDYAAHHPIGVLIFIGFAAMLIAVLRRAGSGVGPPQPVAKPFLTRREQAMLDALQRVLPMYSVHAQVAMGALLAVPTRIGKRSTPADRNSFAQKIVDFVVFDPATESVVALIELDDRSHNAEKDRVRDLMTKRAGYETIRIPASAQPTVNTAKSAVAHLLVDARFSAKVTA